MKNYITLKIKNQTKWLSQNRLRPHFHNNLFFFFFFSNVVSVLSRRIHKKNFLLYILFKKILETYHRNRPIAKSIAQFSLSFKNMEVRVYNPYHLRILIQTRFNNTQDVKGYFYYFYFQWGKNQNALKPALNFKI